MSLLSISHLDMSFGALNIINDLTLEIQQGERHAVIGPNGAGKTTLFNLITGWLKPQKGKVLFQGKNLVEISKPDIVHMGLARSFQINTLFDELTVFENLRLAVQAMHSSRKIAYLRTNKIEQVMEQTHEIACMMGLENCQTKIVGTLPYADKRQLEIGLALASQPKLLLLDEPAAGTTPSEREHLCNLVHALPKDITLLVIEHDMDLVFELCDKITVLNYGSVLASGAPEQVRNNKEVLSCYLGKHHA